MNTVGKHVKNLKVFMSEAFDRGITKNIEFKNKKFKVLEEETYGPAIEFFGNDILSEDSTIDRKKLGKF